MIKKNILISLFLITSFVFINILAMGLEPAETKKPIEATEPTTLEKLKISFVGTKETLQRLRNNLDTLSLFTAQTPVSEIIRTTQQIKDDLDLLKKLIFGINLQIQALIAEKRKELEAKEEEQEILEGDITAIRGLIAQNKILELYRNKPSSISSLGECDCEPLYRREGTYRSQFEDFVVDKFFKEELYDFDTTQNILSFSYDAFASGLLFQDFVILLKILIAIEQQPKFRNINVRLEVNAQDLIYTSAGLSPSQEYQHEKSKKTLEQFRKYFEKYFKMHHLQESFKLHINKSDFKANIIARTDFDGVFNLYSQEGLTPWVKMTLLVEINSKLKEKKAMFFDLNKMGIFNGRAHWFFTNGKAYKSNEYTKERPQENVIYLFYGIKDDVQTPKTIGQQNEITKAKLSPQEQRRQGIIWKKIKEGEYFMPINAIDISNRKEMKINITSINTF